MLESNLIDKIFFFDIGKHQSNDSFFNWISKIYDKPIILDVRPTRYSTSTENIFYCIIKTNIKVVYIKKENVVFSIGAHSDIQSQFMEAIVEYLINSFYDMFDESLLTTLYGDVSDIFSSFTQVVEDTLSNYENLNIIEIPLVTCKGCNKTIPVIIKKSLIENSTKNTTPLVYAHSGHAILIYVDKQYKIRGHDIVGISY